VIEVDRAGKVVWEAPAERGPAVRVCLGLVRLGFDHPRPKGYDLEASLPLRIKGLSSKNPVVRRLSAGALWERPREAEPAVPVLIDTLADTDALTRETAWGTLVRIGRPAAEPVRAARKDKRPLVRAGAVHIMGGFAQQGYYGPDSGTILAEVIAALDDQDVHPRRAAVWALQTFPAHDKVVAALAKALKDPDLAREPNEETVARRAASALRRLGQAANAAVPALIEALRSSDAELRIRAIGALMRIGKPAKAAVPALIQLLQPADVKDPATAHHIRMSAAMALGEMGPEARVAIPAIERVLRDADDQYKPYVKAALEKLKR